MAHVHALREGTVTVHWQVLDGPLGIHGAWEIIHQSSCYGEVAIDAQLLRFQKLSWTSISLLHHLDDALPSHLMPPLLFLSFIARQLVIDLFLPVVMKHSLHFLFQSSLRIWGACMFLPELLAHSYLVGHRIQKWEGAICVGVVSSSEDEVIELGLEFGKQVVPAEALGKVHALAMRSCEDCPLALGHLHVAKAYHLSFA